MNQTLLILALLAHLLFFQTTLYSQQWPEPPQLGSSKWGSDDQRGAANLLTSVKVLEAARLIQTGKVYQLGRIYQEGMPFFGGRDFTMRMLLPLGPMGKNQNVGLHELLISEIGHVGTQLDGLGHVGIGEVFYNGNNRRDFQTAKGLTKLGIENVGVFLTRGVLLDIAALKGVERLEKGYEVSLQDLKEALIRQELSIRPGDAVLIHTGWGSLWMVDNQLYNSGEPGIGIPAAQFLAKQQISVMGSDSWSAEVVPSPDSELAFPVHQILITLNGIYILENIDTAALARDRVYEFAFFFAPLRLKGFAGSPGNPVAIR